MYSYLNTQCFISRSLDTVDIFRMAVVSYGFSFVLIVLLKQKSPFRAKFWKNDGQPRPKGANA